MSRGRTPPPCPLAGGPRRDPGTVTSAHPASTSAHAGSVTGTHAGAVADACGLARSGTVSGTVRGARA